MKLFSSVKRGYNAVGQRLGATIHAPTKAFGQAFMFLLGVSILTLGMMDGASAFGTNVPGASNITYNDSRIDTALRTILGLLEGTFGALIMVAAGVGAILSAAFGQYRAALGCLVVAVGAFILRSFVVTFFNVRTNIAG